MISKIETGKARPGLSIYLQIANVFHVSIDYFLMDTLENYPFGSSELPMIVSLQAIRNQRMLWSPDIVSLNKKISELLQKTFRQDFISRKTIKNTGQLPMYLIENHHDAIVDRDKFNKVQTEMARRSAARSPSKKSPTGLASYTSKYALSERLVCGECGTLYRRCTWTQKGVKRIVWRCVSRLDYGKKYCHNSPTLDEALLQQAILTAISTMMASKETLIQQITGSLRAEVIPFPGEGLSLGDIDRRLAELETQFQKLLKQATYDPAAYSNQFKEILDEQTFLKEKRTVILAENKHNAEINQRIMDATELLDRDAINITEWDESVIRQMVETVKVLSKNEIILTLKGGAEINQRLE